MRGRVVTLAAALVAGMFVPAASATPPPNDDRANAQPIPTFPATIPGTTVDATIERLDPQVSQCGQIQSTVWYRIEQAPDGAIVLGVQGAGLTPVIRVYRLVSNGIKELDCSTAASGQRAQVAFSSVRGATFLVVVGKKANTADADFSLDAKLFLPPPNDAARSAQAIRPLPAHIADSTLGATAEDSDPSDCGLSGGTVWYQLGAGNTSRLVFKLHALGDLDASLVVLQRSRSERSVVGCGRTDKKGNLALAVDVEKGGSYLVVVGARGNSPPGDFTLDVLAAQAPERAPGAHLSRGGVSSSVNGLTDVNDIFWTNMERGTTYRISFRATGCAQLTVASARKSTDVLRALSCSGYATFTPGPDGGGRYIFQVLAPRNAQTLPYRLQIARAGADDLGVGVELPNLTTRTGTLAPQGVDVVDLYHFDVAQTSEVRVRLRQPGSFSLLLLRDDGARVGSGSDELNQRLPAGRYIVAVKGVVGQPGGRYRISLVIRQLTSTTVRSSATSVTPGATVTFTAAASPSPDAGIVEVEIDRFDPLTGWQFSKLFQLHAPGGSVSWTPPAEGRWRARARYVGDLRFSPSASGYVSLLVAKRLAP